jgi:recombination protein RecR
MKYPESIELLIEALRRYPGVGKKTAERYALHTINKFDEDTINQIIEAYHRVKTEIFHCPICGNITDKNPCDICRDDSRDDTTIVVVEEAKDIIAMEKTNRYHGHYHVLNGAISPSNGVGPEDISIKELLERLKEDSFKEVIIATNLSNEGETTARYISRLLQDTDLLVTRIAHGLPAGGNLEYADEITLFKALEGRRKI